MSRVRLAILASHPIHYQIQLVRKLRQYPDLEVTVLFCSRFGLGRQRDHTFGGTVQWYDPSILEGYPYRFLRNCSWERTPASFFGAINPGVVREIRRGQFDAILLQGYSLLTEWLALISSWRVPGRVILRAETCLSEYHPTVHPRLRKLTMAILSRAVDIFLPIGTRSRQFYRHHGIPDSRMLTSPYAVNNDFLLREAQRLRPQREQLRASLKIPEGVPVVLCVSKLIPRKRPMDLLRAFGVLKAPAALVLVGEGPERPALERYAVERGLPNVRFAGFHPPADVYRFYALGDLFVLPSEYEPWGLTVNEAMCFSLPILTTRGVAAGADLVIPGENGFLYPPGDLPALTGHLETLLENADLRREMGRRSVERIIPWNQREAAAAIHRALKLPLGRVR